MVEKKEENPPIFYPRPKSAEYSFLMTEKEKQQSTLKTWKRANKFFTIPLYRLGLLPLLGFGFLFLLLFTKGRKTGKQRITPLEYHKINGTVHIFAGRGEKADWYKNLVANPNDVKIRRGFLKYKVQIEILSVEERKSIFHWYVTKHPLAAKELFGWDRKKDDPEHVDFSFLAEKIPVIKLKKQKMLSEK